MLLEIYPPALAQCKCCQAVSFLCSEDTERLSAANGSIQWLELKLVDVGVNRQLARDGLAWNDLYVAFADKLHP